MVDEDDEILESILCLSIEMRFSIGVGTGMTSSSDSVTVFCTLFGEKSRILKAFPFNRGLSSLLSTIG